MSTCLPFTGSSVWPLVMVAVAVAIAGLALQRLAVRRRGSALLLLLVVAAAAGVATLAPRVDAHAATCDPTNATAATGASMTEAQVEALPVKDDAFVGGGVIVPNQPLDISIGGLVPGETYDAYIASTPRLLGTGVVNQFGLLLLSIIIPSDMESGDHNLFIVGRWSGTGLRQPVVLDASGTSTTSAPGATTSTTAGVTTTTAAPGTTTSTIASGTTTSVAPTTTTTVAQTTTTSVAPSTTTTTVDPGLPRQTVSWPVEADWSLGDSPVVLPEMKSVELSWWGHQEYDVESTGTANCSVDTATRELTFTSVGTCVVRARIPAWQVGWAEGVLTAEITVGPAAVCDDSMNYQRGDTGPGGGRIFYVASSCKGWGRYLEVAPGDWTGTNDSSYQPRWCDTNRWVAGTSGSTIGRGVRNTYALMADCSDTPALRAQAYRGAGQLDWYLPNSGELIELCKWVHGVPQSNANCGGYSSYTVSDFGFHDHYWSSTQASETAAIENWMPGGQDFRNVDKTSAGYIKARPIRAFGLAPTVQASWTTASTRSNSRTNDFTLDFSESITGLTPDDITNAGTATVCIFLPASESGTSIQVTATCATDGSVVPVLAAGSVSGASFTGPARPTPGPGIAVDSVAPTMTLGTIPSTMVSGFAFDVESDEPGTGYIVADSITVTGISDIVGAADSAVNSVEVLVADTAIAINTNGLAPGSYHVYAADRAGNLSAPSATPYTVRAPQNCSVDCLVGDIGPGGGTVFYDAGTVQSWGRWLEAAPGTWQGDDWAHVPVWCDVKTDISGAMGAAIGDGYANTMAMLSGCTSGAAIDVQSYRGGGQVDWFLPSTAEMKMLCGWVKALPSHITNCQSQWGGGYVNNDRYASHYWTSTQVDVDNAIETWMPGGNDYRTVPKDYNYISVRPIRAFGGAATTASIAADQARSTSRTLGFTVDFSGAATGVDAADFDVIGTATGCVITPASSTGTSIHVTVACASDGTVSLRLVAGSVSIGGVAGPTVSANSLMVPIDAVIPTLTVTNAPTEMVKGNPLEVAISERGDIYIVSTTVTVTDRASITGALDATWNSVYSADTSSIALGTSGLGDGTYRVYAIDAAGNVSAADPTTITVRAAQSCTTTCAIGDTGPGGGRVVYDAGSVQSWGRYIEVAPGDWQGVGDGSRTPTWCNTNILVVGADGSAIGTGGSNTAAIVAACTSGAAVDAAAYRGGSFTNWHLPSSDEQRAVCRWVMARIGTGCGGGYGGYVNNLDFTSHYWTSTQVDADNAIETWMPGGNDYRTVGKSTNYVSVRPVRYF